MTLGEAALMLKKSGIEQWRDEARLIFSAKGGYSTASLVGCDPSTDDTAVIDAIRRRAAREPLGYILGEVGFFHESYTVNTDCLIPRSDTECLVEYAAMHLKSGARIADLCCGSGCIGISVLCSTNGTSCESVDISEGALKLTKHNAKRNGVESRLTTIMGDLLCSDPLPDERFDAILSNPPYIATEVYLGLEAELFHEPRIALDGGADGLEFYRRLIPLSLKHLKDSGFIAMEIGYDQGEALRSIAEEHGLDCEIIKDLGGRDRVAAMRRNGVNPQYI